MSDDATPRLGLPYLAASQAQKHVTLNEALSRLDGLVQTAVESRGVTDQPADPADGALYILPAGASGAAWTGRPAGTLMRFEAGGWLALPTAEGHLAWVRDEALIVVLSDGAWIDAEPDVSFQNLPLLGVGTSADAGNPLAVKAGGVLLTAKTASEGGDGDMRLTLNKEGSGDTASLVMQSGWSGRAEFGLAGGEDFSVKVSPDGSAWTEALTIARSDGKATFALSPARPAEATVLTSSGSYAVPAWARRLRFVCIGGGGGGGSGACGSSAADRAGGGGGGAGGRSGDEIDLAELAGGSLTVTVGAGGSGGAGVAVAGDGLAGSAGGDSSVADGAQVLIAAGGGAGGAAGTTGDSTGGAGGYGDGAGNAGGGGSAVMAAAGEDAACGVGPGGGGGGGGMNTASMIASGQDGGHGYLIGQGPGRRAARGSGGAAGAAGSSGAAKAWQRGCGAGGGGGGGGASADGGAGGAGGDPGGGGGGGGACRDTFTSGAGGAGGRGEVWIIAIG